MLTDGEIDLLAGLAWKEDRASVIGYPKAVMGSESYYLVKYDDISLYCSWDGSGIMNKGGSLWVHKQKQL